MYICICNSITDTDIEEAKLKGASKINDLRKHFPICNRCCKCVEEIKKMLKPKDE